MRVMVALVLIGLYLMVGAVESRDYENRTPISQAEIDALAHR